MAMATAMAAEAEHRDGPVFPRLPVVDPERCPLHERMRLRVSSPLSKTFLPEQDSGYRPQDEREGGVRQERERTHERMKSNARKSLP